jgi:hypothetical protein
MSDSKIAAQAVHFSQWGPDLTIEVKLIYPRERNVSNNRKIKYIVEGCTSTLDRR